MKHKFKGALDDFLALVVVPQANAYVVERIGVYSKTWEAGLHFKIPIVDRIVRKISLKEQQADFPPQNIITKDNCLVMVDTIVFFQVKDAKLFTYGVVDPILAIANLSATTLRSFIGNLSLEEAMTSREEINEHVRAGLNEATSKWGIRINRVEIKDIVPPQDVREAMEKQIKAEREKRATILKAEADKQAAILVAEGNAEALVLATRAEREAQILTAQAEKQAKILKAEADKQARILKADGEAEAIVKVQTAKAKGINEVSSANMTKKYLMLQKLDTFAKVGNGRATKIIIPSDIQKMSGLAVSLKEVLQEENINTSEELNETDFEEIGDE